MKHVLRCLLLALLAPVLAHAATGTATHRHADLLTGQALFELGVCLDTGPCLPVSSGPTPDPQIQEGDRVLVDTVQAMTQGRATTRHVLTPLMVRTPRLLGAAPMAAVSGVHPTLIIRIGWPGSDAPGTPAQVEATGRAVADFMAANSYGRVTMTFAHVTVALAQAPAGCNWSSIGTQADAAAKTAGANPAAYLHVVYAIPWTTACQWAGLATIGGGRAWINGIYITSTKVVAHELGHNLGLYHSNSMRCDGGLKPPCSTTEYGDYWDTMGSGDAMPFNAAQKHRLGWIDAPRVTAGSVRLTPIGTSPSAIQVPRGPSTADILFLEHRPTSPTLSHPVLVHLVQSGGTYLLRMGSEVSSWPLPAGTPWTVPGGGPTIRVDAADASGATVTVGPSVVVPPPPPPPPPPGGLDVTMTFTRTPTSGTVFTVPTSTHACVRQVGGTSAIRILTAAGARIAQAPIPNPAAGKPFTVRCQVAAALGAAPAAVTLSVNGAVKLTVAP